MSKPQIYLILHNIRSAYNVGSIFRTADGAGVSKIYLCGITPTPTTRTALARAVLVNSKVSKTALGAEKTVPWEYHKQIGKLLKQLRDDGLWLIALEQTKNSKNIFSYKPPKNKNIALVVGNEVHGLKKILSYADRILEIPMYGKKESLNVAVATGIALYQIINLKL